MWLNNRRQTVAAWEFEAGPALCPLCSGELLPRRGDLVRWHWAHAPRGRGRAACPWEESPWHLRWKLAYLDFEGWSVEMPWERFGQRYVLDACRLSTGRVREFVHSLSPHYLAKHRALSDAGLDVRWIVDGGEWASSRAIRTKDGSGFRRLLKARAFSLVRELSADGDQFPGYVHCNGRLYNHWKDNVWFEASSPGARALLDRFRDADILDHDG